MKKILDHIKNRAKHQRLRSYDIVYGYRSERTITAYWYERHFATELAFPSTDIGVDLLKYITKVAEQGYTYFGLDSRSYASEYRIIKSKVVSFGCKDCKDCKDGFYYPLIGPREPCQTCKFELSGTPAIKGIFVKPKCADCG